MDLSKCLGAIAVFIWASSMGTAAAHAPCDDLLYRPPSDRGTRDLTSRDLLGLRDIGYHNFSDPTGAITLSPDGHHIAFQIRQARPDANDYCLGMFVVDLRSSELPREIASGGELIREEIVWRGLEGYATGDPMTIVPKWSPDGQWVAFLRRENGSTQVWRARSDGGGSEQLTTAPADVRDFYWTDDGMSLVYSDRSALAEARAAIQSEAHQGHRYGVRFVPFAGATPYPMGPIEDRFSVLDIASRTTRAATETEASGVRDFSDWSWLSGEGLVAVSRSGRRAWSARQSAELPVVLWAEDVDGRSVPCDFETCQGVREFWWQEDTGELWFQRREGFASGETGLYRWRVGSEPPQPILITKDALVDCFPRADRLICLHEASTQPRRIVAIDAAGSMTTIFDPNPEFSTLKFGTVERLEWTNDVGTEVFADLVLPPHHRRGQTHPLIIVQYRTRGFLRGGTGDEYPIHLLAQQGFAVLSFERPATYSPPGGHWNDGLADRRSVESALQAGIDLVLSRGVVVGDQIGISGLSDGASTAQFSLINGNRYAAASLSSCSFEPAITMSIGGPLLHRDLRAVGFPAVTDSGDEIWNAYSLTRNAANINTPILIQADDDEYLLCLQTYAAFQEHGRPIELFVFPEEYHIKWQPAHRAEIYRRNVAWFNFWLRDHEDHVFGREEEYVEWRILRGNLGQSR